MWEYVVDNKLKEKSEVRNKTIWEKNVNDQRGGHFLVWALFRYACWNSTNLSERQTFSQYNVKVVRWEGSYRDKTHKKVTLFS
jgi:hypothetical protein